MRLIDADALISKSGDWYVEEGPAEGFIGTLEMLINQEPTVQVAGIWIPITSRELTEEERKDYIEGCTSVYTSEMPEDCEGVYITTEYGKAGATEFYDDGDCTYFDNYDEDDVIAWAKPIPYKGTVNEPD